VDSKGKRVTCWSSQLRCQLCRSHLGVELARRVAGVKRERACSCFEQQLQRVFERQEVLASWSGGSGGGQGRGLGTDQLRRSPHCAIRQHLGVLKGDHAPRHSASPRLAWDSSCSTAVNAGLLEAPVTPIETPKVPAAAVGRQRKWLGLFIPAATAGKVTAIADVHVRQKRWVPPAGPVRRCSCQRTQLAEGGVAGANARAAVSWPRRACEPVRQGRSAAPRRSSSRPCCSIRRTGPRARSGPPIAVELGLPVKHRGGEEGQASPSGGRHPCAACRRGATRGRSLLGQPRRGVGVSESGLGGW